MLKQDSPQMQLRAQIEQEKELQRQQDLKRQQETFEAQEMQFQAGGPQRIFILNYQPLNSELVKLHIQSGASYLSQGFLVLLCFSM